MRSLIVFLFIQLSFASPYHVVFDIDWTAYDVPKNPVRGSLQFGDHHYKPAVGFLRVIELLRLRDDIKISFYSGGKRDRNLFLLKETKLSDGTSLHDITHKVLSFEDLKVISTDESKRFFERYKKDLSKISKDLSKVVVFDDIKDFYTVESSPQVVFLESRIKYFSSYQEARRAALDNPHDPYLPKNRLEWSTSRFRMKRVKRLIEKALHSDGHFIDSILSEVNKESWTFKGLFKGLCPK